MFWENFWANLLWCILMTSWSITLVWNYMWNIWWHLNVLRKEKLYANLDKCTFCTEQIAFLGFVPSGWPGRLRARPQPSARDSFPLVACEFLQKRGQRGALAAVCTPTLKSASKKHQKLFTYVSEHRVWHSEGGKRTVYMCVLSLSGKNILQSLVCTLEARASN